MNGDYWTQVNLERAWKNRLLVHGALKAAHVSPSSADYDDLFQEGLLIYAQCLGEADLTYSEKSIKNWIFQRIIWMVQDYYRQTHFKYECGEVPEDVAVINECDFRLDLRSSLRQLPMLERVVFIQCLHEGRRRPEVCARLGMSYSTFNRVKKRMLENLREMMK